MRQHTVAGGGGLKLHVREWGDPGAPAILFLHGWSQHHLCWAQQYQSPLADEFRLVAMDLRGHGQSQAPLGAETYTTGTLWADDVAAVIRSLGLGPTVLVGWSYGGLVIGDYLRKYGQGSVAGVNLVAATIVIGPAWFGSHIGPGFLDNAPSACSEDQAVALAGIQGLLHACFAQPLDAAAMELAMGWNMLVHPQVRANLIARTEDFQPEYAQLSRPLLVTYGGVDPVILPSMATLIRGSAPAARLSDYADAAHAPFLEDSARFNAELGAFARQAFAARAPSPAAAVD